MNCICSVAPVRPISYYRGAYDPVFNGGTPISGSAPVGWVGMTGGYGYGHTNGTDIVVAHFSADATASIGSTYVGGSGNDGVNNVLPLSHNYGDHFRGEIALDLQEWPASVPPPRVRTSQ